LIQKRHEQKRDEAAQALADKEAALKAVEEQLAQYNS
jgi:hypothetical protein